MRNGSLWSNAVFEKEVIFYEFDFKTSELDFEVPNQASENTQLCVTRVFFLSLLHISQLWRPNEFKFSQICYFMQEAYVAIHQERDWSLTITNSVQCLRGKFQQSFKTTWHLASEPLSRENADRHGFNHLLPYNRC